VCLQTVEFGFSNGKAWSVLTINWCMLSSVTISVTRLDFGPPVGDAGGQGDGPLPARAASEEVVDLCISAREWRRRAVRCMRGAGDVGLCVAREKRSCRVCRGCCKGGERCKYPPKTLPDAPALLGPCSFKALLLSLDLLLLLSLDLLLLLSFCRIAHGALAQGPTSPLFGPAPGRETLHTPAMD
jgi:hypothetical protein